MAKTRFNLAGRLVIVTGGGSGIGKVYSTRLAEAGALRYGHADSDHRAPGRESQRRRDSEHRLVDGGIAPLSCPPALAGARSVR